eukprot:8667117-Alexandrium_andersonii.AAC.1
MSTGFRSIQSSNSGGVKGRQRERQRVRYIRQRLVSTGFRSIHSLTFGVKGCQQRVNGGVNG